MKKDKLYTVGGNIQTKKLYPDGGMLPMPQNYNWGNGLTLPSFQVAKGQPLSSGTIGKVNDFFKKQTSGGGTSGLSSSLVGTASATIGNMIGNAIGDGYSTGASGTVEGIRNLVQSVNTGNPVIDGIKNTVVGIGTRLYNRAFGIKKNMKNIGAMNKNAATARLVGNELGNTSTNSDVLNAAYNMTSALNFSDNQLVKAGLTKHAKEKAEKERAQIRANQAAALAYQNHGLATGANNADYNMDSGVMRDFLAFGGPLETNDNMIKNNKFDLGGIFGNPYDVSGAISYDLAMTDLINKRKRAEQGNAMKNMFAGMPTMNTYCSGGKLFDLGGPEDVLGWSPVDNRTDSTRQGIPDGSMSYGADYQGPLGVAKQVLDTYAKDANPYLNTGIAPGPAKARNAAEALEMVRAMKAAKEAKAAAAAAKAAERQQRISAARSAASSYVGKTPEQIAAMRAARSAAGKKSAQVQAGRPRTEKELHRYDDARAAAAKREEMESMRKTAKEASRMSGKKYSPTMRNAQGKRSATRGAITVDDIMAFGGPLYDTLFALGGDIQSNGADWTTGLTHIEAGKSHEENPYEGVQVGVDQEGTPNLVEEGETIFNDYVYSNRIELDEEAKKAFHIGKKRDITYAEMSKKLEKEATERPNDPISKAALKAQMQELAEHQERQKQEMEAERAREAFEALSPEEQAAVMQQVAQQEQAAQEQAMQEEALAAEQQDTVSPEEAAIMQQQGVPTANAMGAVSAGQPDVMEGQPVMACGGKVNKFAPGGDTEVGMQEAGVLPTIKAEDLLSATDEAALQREAVESSNAINQMLNEGYSIPEIIKAAIFKELGFYTQSQFDEWAKNNNIGKVDWEKLSTNKNFISALKKKNPALADVVSKGYDFGQFNPDKLAKATIQSISRGNWKATNGRGWRGSTDLAFQQATKGMTDAQVEALSTEQLAQLMRNTDAYKNTSKWLENSDNALLYLNTLLDDRDTPEVAKEYARKFVQDGRWKDDFTYDYSTVFGKDGKGVRETNPGTYWHSVAEANRDNLVRNLVYNRDKDIWEDIVGDIPTNLKLNNSYTWNDPSSQYTYNYYMGPGREFHRVEGHTDYLDGTPDTWQGVGKETRRETLPNGDTVIYHAAGDGADANGNRKVVPNLRSEWPRYAGLFGPAVGLGMQALGIGRPNTKALDAVLEGFDKRGASYADYKPIGNYLRYSPMDIWAEQNRLNANSRATDRAILNSGAVQGSKVAGLLASGYNDQLASGQLYRQALEYNDNKRHQVADFNRGTDMFNAQAYNQLAQFNASQRDRDRQVRAQLGMQAAAQKADMDAGWYNGIYGNVAGLFRGISDLGRENAERNMLARLAASGALGTIDPEGAMNAGLIKYADSAAEGGKIKRKKNKRRGLTI